MPVRLKRTVERIPVGMVVVPLLCGVAINTLAPRASTTCDAETDPDLHSVVQASLTLGEHILWVGSAGLAHQLAEASAPSTQPSLEQLPTRTAPTLFVVGSLSEVARAQVAQLSRMRDAVSIDIDPEDLLAGPHRCT